MSIQTKDIANKSIDVDNNRCWMEFQYHDRDCVRGWAFRVGGAIGRLTEWEYGYSSQAEAESVAIDVIEERLKSNIRQLTKNLSEQSALLEKVQDAQRLKPSQVNEASM